MKHEHDAAFWDQMYRSRPRKTEPNGVLAETVAGLSPGTALDVCCGMGADAIWLATQGWKVTAIDMSNVALDRAREVDVAHEVNWIHGDALVWQPPSETYDLVSSQFLHVAPSERSALFERLGSSVRRGGTMLVVAHHASDLQTTVGRAPNAELYFTAEEIEASLVPAQWEITFAGTRPRSGTDHQGRALTIQDMVFKARRRP
ncbi:MAG: class I SAM-dependent methyltransferase [Archangium sp.]|nr:class I SAM-dependent methyltransferase [Archangium sp.]MDP3575432.1 class I SAM-dependent methyltransferase [Archangium sp.]